MILSRSSARLVITSDDVDIGGYATLNKDVGLRYCYCQRITHHAYGIRGFSQENLRTG